MILGGIVFPVFEEFLHRYYLDYKTRSLLTSTILLFLFYFVAFDELNFLQNAIHFLSFIFLFIIFVLKKFYNYINLKILVWGSILFFGLFHLSTYESDMYSKNYLIVPVLVMPQFIGGFFLAFIRIQFRFIHCIIFHGVFNIFLFLLGYVIFIFQMI